MYSRIGRPLSEIKNLEIIQDCYAIYRRIKKELTLTHVAAHVGTEGNELADRKRGGCLTPSSVGDIK